MARPLLILCGVVEHFLKACKDRQMLPNIIVAGCLILHDLVDHFFIAILVYKQRNGYNSATAK
jgi:hypothetical protein